MHVSIWKFDGDPDDLTRRYDALVAEMPSEQFVVNLCLRAPDGIVIVDACPSREAFEAFSASEEFRSARRSHGLPDPSRLDDYPVHAAFINSPAPAISS